MISNPSTRTRWSLLGAVALVAVVTLTVASALAAVTGTLTLGASTILPGASTTVDATFAEDNASGVLGGTVVSVIVTPQPGASGTVTLETTDVSCVPASGPQVDCLWSTGTASKALALSATASSDARGTFDITTQVEGDDPDTPGNEIVIRPVQSATLDIEEPITVAVAGPTPNPATPDSVATLEVTYTPIADATNVDTSIDLLGTGGNGTLSLVSATNELTNCSAVDRIVSCDYDPTVAAGPSVLTVGINVGPGAADGDGFRVFVNALRGPVAGSWNIVETRDLDIVAPSTTTTTTSTTTTVPSTTTTAPTTTTTIPEVETDIADSGSTGIWAAALAILGLAALGLATLRAYRSEP